jgi:DivIVA domain-containing protein
LANGKRYEGDTPDLRQQRFNTVKRGSDRGEVNAFLAEAAEDYENALRENVRLRLMSSASFCAVNSVLRRLNDHVGTRRMRALAVDEGPNFR